jgi:hypothetical protein
VVLAQVAKDVGELKSESQVFGVGLPALLLVPEDAQADEPDNRGHAVAVTSQLLEGRVAELGQVHLDSREKLVQVAAWDPKPDQVRSQRSRGGLVRLPFVASRHLASPSLDFLAGAPLVRFFVHAVVDRAAERMDREDGLALVGRERAEGEGEAGAPRGRARVSH